jgi:hypothetical protein
MVRGVRNDELERLWKEAFVAYSGKIREEMKEALKISDGIAGAHTENRIEHLRNIR